MTKTFQKRQEQRRVEHQMLAEYQAVIRAEFPAGTKVRYLFGANWIAGVVEKTVEWEWSTDVTVRNITSGKTRKVEAHELALMPSEADEC